MIVVTDDCQFPNPNGANIGAITLPIAASILLSSSTIVKLKSNDCKNQITMQDAKIIVPAFLMNASALSNI